jgi:general stress protein 26
MARYGLKHFFIKLPVKDAVMLQECLKLINTQQLCVLATMGPKGPHASLMAFVGMPESDQLFVATPRDTLKFKNIKAHPSVSVLIDSRVNHSRETIIALTIMGTADEVDDRSARIMIRERLLGRHPDLAGLFMQPDVAFISIAIQSLQLLKGPQQAFYHEISSDV